MGSNPTDPAIFVNPIILLACNDTAPSYCTASNTKPT
jgi:hypothetical protein